MTICITFVNTQALNAAGQVVRTSKRKTETEVQTSVTTVS